MKVTCCCVIVFRFPPVKATRCCVTVFVGTTGEGKVLLRDSFVYAPVKASCCCVAVLRIPLAKATSCTCVYSW